MLIDDERFTQDFILLGAPTFTTPDVRANLALQKRVLAGTPIFWFLDPRYLLGGLMHGLWARAYRERRLSECDGTAMSSVLRSATGLGV